MYPLNKPLCWETMSNTEFKLHLICTYYKKLFLQNTRTLSLSTKRTLNLNFCDIKCVNLAPFDSNDQMSNFSDVEGKHQNIWPFHTMRHAICMHARKLVYIQCAHVEALCFSVLCVLLILLRTSPSKIRIHTFYG